MDEAGRHALITSSSPAQPPQVWLANASGQRLAWIEQNAVSGNHPWAPYSTSAAKPRYGRLKAADRPVLEEGATTCCYAKSEKSWISDPQGVVWEAFLTNGEATVYGDSPPLAALSPNAAETNCCAPALPAGQEGLSEAEPDRPANPSCCG